MTMTRIFVCLIALAQPAQAQDANLNADVWSQFKTHCGKFIDAVNLSQEIAAFKPNDFKAFTTTDGALTVGGAEAETLTNKGLRFATFNVNVTRHEGGTVRSCTLIAHNHDDADLSKLPALVQSSASELLGDDFLVVGGPILTQEGMQGTALLLTTGGFPPERALSVTSGQGFVSMGYTFSIANKD